MKEPSICLYGCRSDESEQRIAETYNLVLLDIESAPQTIHLRCKGGRLALFDQSNGYFQLDTAAILKQRVGFFKSLLARACDVKNKPRILDALGGWGTDSLKLVQAGCEVTYCELSPLVSFICQDRASLMNMDINVHTEDVLCYLNETNDQFDVIYLDPMFPEHPKRSLPSRSMQVLSELAMEVDFEGLFEKAISLALSRVVVKQRRKQPRTIKEPSWTLKGRSIRFDVYQS